MKHQPYTTIQCMIIALALFMLTACIHPEVTTIAVPLDVTGEYRTGVTLTDDNSCGDVTVQSLPTIIQQTPGTTELIFSHAGNQYSASLNADDTFVTEHKKLVAGSTIYTVTYAGTFSSTGFSATGTVEMQQTQEPKQCRYIVKMDGAKVTKD